jgi:ATP-dependent HslUV protease ATP-binding subunit HslU
MDTEGIRLEFTDDSLKQVARYATKLNETTENIGARRLHTILEKVLEDISFDAPEMKTKSFTVDAAYVEKQLDGIVKDEDLSRYIL